jgi:hypothetical protein
MSIDISIIIIIIHKVSCDVIRISRIIETWDLPQASHLPRRFNGCFGHLHRALCTWAAGRGAINLPTMTEADWGWYHHIPIRMVILKMVLWLGLTLHGSKIFQDLPRSSIWKLDCHFFQVEYRTKVVSQRYPRGVQGRSRNRTKGLIAISHESIPLTPSGKIKPTVVFVI